MELEDPEPGSLSAAARRLRIITKATEPAASKTIAIRIGTKGEEPPLSEPGSATPASSSPAPLPPAPLLPWLLWPLAESPLEFDFDEEPPAEPPIFEAPAEPEPPLPPTPLVEPEPGDRFDSLGGLPSAEAGALEYSIPADEA